MRHNSAATMNCNVDCPNIKNIMHAPKHPAPHPYTHQGAGNGTNHDPSHGGIT